MSQLEKGAVREGSLRSNTVRVKLVVAIVVLGLLAALLLSVVHFLIRWKLPARIPPELGFEREIASDEKLREIAEKLAKKFPGPRDGVVCLGVVRGTAARVLFHSGPENRGRNVNIYRPDYVLHVVRQGKKVVLRLDTNRPYRYLRIRRSELDPLVRVLSRCTATSPRDEGRASNRPARAGSVAQWSFHGETNALAATASLASNSSDEPRRQG